jgi:hypothetical protein
MDHHLSLLEYRNIPSDCYIILQSTNIAMFADPLEHIISGPKSKWHMLLQLLLSACHVIIIWV